jgi:hypothetical protein
MLHIVYPKRYILVNDITYLHFIKLNEYRDSCYMIKRYHGGKPDITTRGTHQIQYNYKNIVNLISPNIRKLIFNYSYFQIFKTKKENCEWPRENRMTYRGSVDKSKNKGNGKLFNNKYFSGNPFLCILLIVPISLHIQCLNSKPLSFLLWIFWKLMTQYFKIKFRIASTVYFILTIPFRK